MSAVCAIHTASSPAERGALTTLQRHDATSRALPRQSDGIPGEEAAVHGGLIGADGVDPDASSPRPWRPPEPPR